MLIKMEILVTAATCCGQLLRESVYRGSGTAWEPQKNRFQVWLFGKTLTYKLSFADCQLQRHGANTLVLRWHGDRMT